MNKEELRIWFCDKFNSCYPVVRDDFKDTIFWVYNEQYVRKLKLCKLNNKEITKPKKIIGPMLFGQNLITKLLFCNYNEIWKHLEENRIYIYKMNEIKVFINNSLTDNTKIQVYKQTVPGVSKIRQLDEKPKWKIYTLVGTSDDDQSFFVDNIDGKLRLYE